MSDARKVLVLVWGALFAACLGGFWCVVLFGLHELGRASERAGYLRYLRAHPASASPCTDSVRIVPLNAPTFCGQNQHSVTLLPAPGSEGTTGHVHFLYCACAREGLVPRVDSR